MKLAVNIVVILIMISGISSCDRIKNKAERVADKIEKKATNKVKVQARKVTDKVFPVFDSDVADSKNNRERFKDFIKVELTPDIRNIYCFDDAIGIDADYMFAFNCDLTTSNRIIKMHNLTIDTISSDNAFGLQNDFEWWKKEEIAKLTKYSWTNGEHYFKYFWYDSVNKKAYFFDFDM